ncbi:MAG: YdjY domain-containing protein [Kiritimatiellae bacterium]|nr:YdjY domain-containing protein [Kiritimatiellia bacterium]
MNIVLLIAAFGAVAEAADVNPLWRAPFVTADRERREVRIDARATGIQGGTLCEFFLIATNSGHDYEAIAVSLARPSDVHRALEHIGLQPGHPVDPKALRFWPRGERVIAEFEWRDAAATGGAPARVRFEDTLVDTRTGTTLPREGLVFVGSARVPAAAGTGTVYAADEIEPCSIASAFNLETTVLDIPRRGSQSALYDYQIANSNHVWAKGEPLTVVLRPEPRPDGRPRVRDFALHIGLAEGRPTVSLAESGGAAAVAGAPEEVERRLRELVEGGFDPHLDVQVRPEVPVRELRVIGEAVARFAELSGVRIEPPSAGQVYYRALSPDPSLRRREERPSQPWELRLQAAPGGGWSAVLVRVEAGRDILTDAPTFFTREFPAQTPAELRARLDAEGPGLPVIVVFAPGAMTYGEMMRFVAPLMTTHPVIHVFAD